MREEKFRLDFKVFDFRNFSMREALWIAILLHLLILLVPQNLIPFILFASQPALPEPEPISFNLARQPEQEPQSQPEDNRVAAPEELEARTPERSDAQAETRDPTSEGITNLKRFEAPQSQPEPERSEEQLAPAESGPESVEDAQPAERPNNSETPELSEEELKELSDRLAEELKNPQFRLSDVPAVFNQPKPSSAEEGLDGIIQFDTYAWDWVPYRDLMLLKLYREWVPVLRRNMYFRLGRPGLTIYRFVITRDGSVHQLDLLRPAEVGQYDEAAQHAIVSFYPGRETAFPPLPDHFPKETLVVTIGFYVNTYAPDNK